LDIDYFYRGEEKTEKINEKEIIKKLKTESRVSNRLAKADKRGMKSLDSFFSKK
jgi:hypothetical protein